MSLNHPHIGEYIRKELLEKHGLKVTKAASILNIGRQQLSCVLNGKSSLSQELAEKLGKVFGADVAELMRLQAEFIANSSSRVDVNAYVPPFIGHKAHEITDWSKDNRDRFPQLIQELCRELGNGCICRFHSWRNNYCSGWDGIVTSTTHTSFPPCGKSYWELSTSNSVLKKANNDFRKRVAKSGITEDEMSECTYVCVTAEPYSEVDKWERNNKGKWKEVILIDACKLEYLLSQTLHTQIWLAEEMGKDIKGISSLQAEWDKWAKVCMPSLPVAMFESQVSQYANRLNLLLETKDDACISIYADTHAEMLAFLYCAFTTSASLKSKAPEVVVFRNLDTLEKFQHTKLPCTVIWAGPEPQKAYNRTNPNMRYIVFHDKCDEATNADIILSPMGYNDMGKTLIALEKKNANSEKELRKCGASRTAFRRLSMPPSTRRPDWCKKPQYKDFLMALAIIGIWDKDNPETTLLLERLSGSSRSDIDTFVSELHQIEDAPLIKNQHRIRITSAHECLTLYTNQASETFLKQYELIIQEAVAHLKNRIRSSEDSVTKQHFPEKMLQRLFKSILFFRGAKHATSSYSDFIQNTSVYLQSLTEVGIVQFFSNYHDIVSVYAEIEGQAFLTMLGSQTNDFSSLINYYKKAPEYHGKIELLQALEIIAWRKHLFQETVEILATLAELDTPDAIYSARRTLTNILRWWMPQCTLTYAELYEVVKKLHTKHSFVISSIIIKHMNIHGGFGEYTSQPSSTLTTIPDDAGQPQSNKNAQEFREKLVKLLFSKEIDDVDLLATLCPYVAYWNREIQVEYWRNVLRWNETAADRDRVTLRNSISNILRHNDAFQGTKQTARSTYKAIEPVEHCYKILNLFLTEQVNHEKNITYEDCIVLRDKKRSKAIEKLYREDGIKGIEKLLTISGLSKAIGKHAASALPSEYHAELIHLAVENLKANWCKDFLIGFLSNTTYTIQEETIIHYRNIGDMGIVHLLFICLPCNRHTWNLLSTFGENETAYWKECTPIFYTYNDNDSIFLVERMIQHERAHEVINFATFLKEKLPSRLLIELLKSLSNSIKIRYRQHPDEKYCVRSLLKYLHNSLSASTEELAQVQFAYACWGVDDTIGLTHYNTHLKNTPAAFIKLIEMLKSEAPRITLDYKFDVYNKKSHAYHLLDNISPFGENDTQAHFHRWFSQVRSIANERDLITLCDIELGKVLARFYLCQRDESQKNDIIDLIENLNSEQLFRGFNHVLLNHGLNISMEASSKAQKTKEFAELCHRKYNELIFSHSNVAKKIFQHISFALEHFAVDMDRSFSRTEID